ncbi:uncharacterized protein F4812DRAFT_427720 [Daldinia caldariorum]|uniref:uncharacterized protein n=1 Tax=Daldinia caldariorum TaxID=326644 RepID=UPI0020085B07|nr:uncharacterized protein F4812DRAFT_427720 [Daldinia caldariorum]KAI1467830.1 hypothetical protein F4812DRAFT_427720 [Daldinia caldariorum]
MAFHQPTRQAAQRVFRPLPEDEESPQLASTSQTVQDSQTWVLFSPPTDAGTSTSYLTSTHKTTSTPGRSRLSEIGSLGTVAPSGPSAERRQSSSFVDAAEEDDDTELDSLDSHLAEFRSGPSFYDPPHAHPFATPVVPGHNGLGMFRLEQDGINADLQERLYAFEQYNPHRVTRPQSLDLNQIERVDETTREMDKMKWIEAWRLEQSRCLLEEIQKETRRRRRSVASVSVPNPVEERDDDVVTMSGLDDSPRGAVDQGQEWHDHDESEEGTHGESILGRITRKVVRDILGIDDKMLSILFGEELPDEEDLCSTPKLTSTSASQQTDARAEDAADSGWKLKMLERVAKELGLLIHRLSDHPGAFSTFSRVQQMSIPYAGLPSIPESANDATTSARTEEPPAAVPEFQPTLATKAQQPIDVPQVTQPTKSGQANTLSQSQLESAALAFTQEEWEQELDVRLVFRYLRSRFTSRSSNSGAISSNSGAASSSMQDVAAKVARVRQHHPLMSRPRTAERRKSKTAVPSSPLFKHASSCASQSTRKSVRKSSASSSRHYWDIGGSVGTGSMIATTGPMGSWGEV